jgi:hypothetical protein
VNALKDERRALQTSDPLIGLHETEQDNAHIGFAIVFLGTIGLFVAGVVWVIIG